MSLLTKLVTGATRLLPQEREYMTGPLRGQYLRAMYRWTIRERIDVGNFDFLREGMIRFTHFQAVNTPGGMMAVSATRLLDKDPIV